MSELLEAIYLDTELHQYSTGATVEDDHDKRRLGPLGKINLFVGANNSGKSRLMRMLAATERLKAVPRVQLDSGEHFEDFAKSVRALGKVIKEILAETGAEVNGLTQTAEALVNFRYVGENASKPRNILAIIKETSETSRPQTWSAGGNPDIAVFRAQHAARDMMTPWTKHHDVEKLATPLGAIDRLYIPTLRSLREIGSAEDIFEKQTRIAYFKTANTVRIFTGLNLYDEVTSLLLGHHDERERIRDFEGFIGDSFFEGKPVSLVPKQPKNGSPRELTIKIGAEKEYPIRELGDGIQSIIILTFPLFMQGDKPLLAFIEEPELFMHPWLQRVFLEVLSRRFPSHQYFLTTHSNHFLDLTLDVDDVSVFTLEKMLQGDNQKQQEAQFAYTHVSGGDRRPLELLGVRNSSVFLSNCTIWVEGITDRRYVAHWLELYQQQLAENGVLDKAHWFKEDLHYSFVEYSGANLVHWSLLDENGPDVERLCGKLFLITDSDGATEASSKGQNHKRLEAKLEKDFCLLPAKEIENLTKPEVLLKVLKSYGEDEANLKLPDHTGYLDKPLGTFIEQKVLIDSAKKKRPGSYAKDKTISDKLGFCNKVIAATPTWQEMSKEAQDLAGRVFNFIKVNNPRPQT
jgi:hypothetical protein